MVGLQTLVWKPPPALEQVGSPSDYTIEILKWKHWSGLNEIYLLNSNFCIIQLSSSLCIAYDLLASL